MSVRLHNKLIICLSLDKRAVPNIIKTTDLNTCSFRQKLATCYTSTPSKQHDYIKNSLL